MPEATYPVMSPKMHLCIAGSSRSTTSPLSCATSDMAASGAIRETGIANLAPDPRDGLARDRSLVVDRVLANPGQDAALLLGARRQLQIRQQRGNGRQAGVLADHDAVGAAEQHRVE